MARGDIYETETAGIYYVDVGLWGTPEYGAVYIIDGDRPAVVETGTGDGDEVVLDALATLGIDPGELAAIVLTHVHLDHAGGAGSLAGACSNADVYVHERGATHLVDPGRLWAGTKATVGDLIEYYPEPEPVPEERVVTVAGGDTIDLGTHALAVSDAPGHAPHQAVLYHPGSEGVFVADAAGIHLPAGDGVQPTTPPPTFDLEQCLADVRTLQELDPATLYYSHFGATAADGQLAAYAETLRSWVGEIEAVRNRLDDDEAVVAAFLDEMRGHEGGPEDVVRAQIRMNVEGVLGYLDGRE